MPKSKRRFKSVFRDFTQGAKATGYVATQTAKSAGKTTSQGVNAAGSVISQRAEAARETVTERAKSARDVTAQAATAAESAVGQSTKVAGDRVGDIGRRIQWGSVLPEQARNSLAATIESSKSLSGSSKRKLIAQMGPAFGRLSTDDKSVQAQAFSIIQSSLSSPQISREINAWLQSLVKGSATDYDKKMDAVYNANRIGGGGSYHRLFDGGHSPVGSFQAARDALPDDSMYEEVAGWLQALARDATTPRGLPLVTWDQETFNNLANTLEKAGISRSWLNDLVTYDAVELIVGSISILAVALNWNNDDVEEFSSLVGGMGLSAAVSANPLMLIVTVVALARAFHVARKTGDWKEFTDGLLKGGICTGAVLLVTSSSLVSGPAVVVLLTGICVGILANQATKRVSFVEIGQFIVIEISKTPLLVENAITSAKDVLPNST